MITPRNIVVSVTLALTPCLAALAETGSATSQTNTETVLEELMVVGEKIERSLKDTTSSVSVIPEETLRSLQHLTLSNAVSEVPNVVALSGAVPDIRGVTGNGAAGGFNSISGGAKGRVSILIDGVAEPFVADFTGDSGIWDIEQIEVYRGPQSTSNGRDSIGGSIYIKTKDPSYDWEGAVRVGYRNQEGYLDTSAVLSGPLIDDKLAFRISLQRLDGETLTSNDEYETNPADYDLNELATNRVKAKLLWTPTENLQTLLTYSSNREQGDSGRVYYSAENPYDYERIFFRDMDTDSETISLNIDYQFSDAFSVDVLVAMMDYKWGFDSYESLPDNEQQLQVEDTNNTIDVKLNIGKSGDRVAGVVGLAYFERE